MHTQGTAAMLNTHIVTDGLLKSLGKFSHTACILRPCRKQQTPFILAALGNYQSPIPQSYLYTVWLILILIAFLPVMYFISDQ